MDRGDNSSSGFEGLQRGLDGAATSGWNRVRMTAASSPNITAEERLQEKCDHEAGHLAMLHVLGLTFVHRYTIVIPDTDTEKGGGLSYDADPFDLQHDIFIGLAGMAAQAFGVRRRTGKTMDDPVVKDRVWTAGFDDRAALRCVHKVENAIIMARWQDVYSYTTKLWPSIQALSAHLTKAPHILYHEEPRMILEAAKGSESSRLSLERYQELRGPADPKNFNSEDFGQRHPGIPFVESFAQFATRQSR